MKRALPVDTVFAASVARRCTPSKALPDAEAARIVERIQRRHARWMPQPRQPGARPEDRSPSPAQSSPNAPSDAPQPPAPSFAPTRSTSPRSVDDAFPRSLTIDLLTRYPVAALVAGAALATVVAQRRPRQAIWRALSSRTAQRCLLAAIASLDSNRSP